MKKEFVPYELAVKLKTLGFDEPCLAYYQKSAVIGDDTILPIQIRNKASNFNDNEYSKMGVPFCSASTFSQAFRWFREKYSLFTNVDYDWNDEVFRVKIMKQNEDKSCNIIYVKENDYIKEFKTYEEAELACLDKLIEMAH